MPVRRNGFLLVFSLLILVTVLSTVALKAQSHEIRAFWVDAFGNGFKTSAQVTTLINDIRAANANAIFPEVRKRGDAYYNGSPYEPKPTDISPSSFDPLQDMITKAHDTTNGKRRVEVHAWIVSYKIWGSQTSFPPASNPPHPYIAHPDWLTQDAAGNTWDGTSYSFDPGHPEVQQYTYNVCMDIISRYDVDGLNFDYIRYTGNTWGYHPVTVARFNARYGRTGQPAATDPLWLQFRRDQVTALVRKVYLNAIALKPHVKISADTITWGASGVSSDAQWLGSAAYSDVLQDWRGWMQEGILDLNVPMNYYREHQYPQAYVNWMNFAKDRKFDRHVAIGPGIYLNYTSNAISQMRATRNVSPSGNLAEGVCGYVYKQPDAQGTPFSTFAGYLVNSPNAADPRSPAIFSTPVDIPPMPWKTAPTKGHLKGFIYGARPGEVLDGAKVQISAPANRAQTNDATGFYGFVDLSPGTYTVTATYPGYSTVTTNLTITAGQVLTRDIVLPLFGPPEIVAQPQSTLTVYRGAPASFTITASGAGPLAYQWRLDGIPLPGATNATWSTSAAETNDAGSYSVVVTNSYGAVTSSPAALTVVIPPASTRLLPLWKLAPGSRPYLTTGSTERGLAYNAKNNRLLVVSRAAGNNVYALNGDTGADLYTLNTTSTVISGGTFALNMIGVAEDGAVYAANLTTDTATSVLKIYRWANDSASTVPTLGYSGAPAAGRWGDTIDVRGSGTGTQIVMASRNGTAFAVFRTSNGTTFIPTIFTPAVTAASLGLGVAFGAGNSIWAKSSSGFPLQRISFDFTGATAQLLQSYGPEFNNSITAISAQPTLGYLAGVAIETPDNLKLYDVSGANVISLAETNAFPTDNPNSNFTGSADFGADRVYALATGNGIIALRVEPKAVSPAILAGPENQVLQEGDDAVFSVTATGTAPLHYQWLYEGAPIPNANSSTYTRASVLPAYAGNYSVLITNIAGRVTSTNALLTVAQPPTITSAPQPQDIRVGQKLLLTVSASGTQPMSYRWFFNGVIIPDATTSTLTLPSATTNHTGSYIVGISNLAGTVSSPAVLVTVHPVPTAEVLLTENSVSITATGDPGTYLIEASADMATWNLVDTVKSPDGKLQWSELINGASQRFFRITWSP